MKNRSILLVDDEPLILDTLARDLTTESSHFEVGTAANGEEALARLEERFWHLVITDLIMPGLDGFQVLKAAKRNNLVTMVIVLTGYADIQLTIDALRLGADDFLLKPCDTDELLFRMSNCFVKQDLLLKVRMYEHILPVCCYCKRIRDDRGVPPGTGRWLGLEEYLARMTGGSVSHGCCPDCFAKFSAGCDP